MIHSEKSADALAALEAGIAAVTSDTTFKAWTNFLSMAARYGHNYSMNNRIWLWVQLSTASKVMSYKAWQQCGRQVRKGEKALSVFAPMFSRKDASDPDAERKLVGFKAVNVFDVSQTDGPELIPPTPSVLTGDDAGLYLRLLDVAAGMGFDVTEGDADGAHGYCIPAEKKIRIQAGQAPAMMAKTLAHEIGHGILHADEAGRAMDKADKELEAESVAFLVMHHFGFGQDAASYSFEYVAGWVGDDATATLRRQANRIGKAASQIIEAADGKVETVEEVEAA